MGPFRISFLAVTLVICKATEILEEVDTALAEDDACGAGVDGGCALNALQLRAGRMQTSEEVVADSPVTTGTTGIGLAQTSGHPVVRLELYRAMNKKDLEYDFANVDMASVGGVMDYLHTDIVGEHADDYDGYGHSTRFKSRLNDIDTIVSVPALVRNPDSVIDTVGAVDSFVDFAKSAHFIDGEATGPAYNWNFGDIVGAQRGGDSRFPTREPYYRFSLSGFCPNLKFDEKEKGAQRAIKARKDAETGSTHRRRRHRGVCMTYADRGNLPYGEVLRGGLCPNGTLPGKVPTGGPGCIYTYTEPTQKDTVYIDDLVGITQEQCGSRKCKDYEDFRKHCSNRRYHKKFNYKSRRRYSKLVKSKACVEYDIHKACARSCNSKACLRVPSHRREIGLPFWKGRCSSTENAKRSEALAEAFGIADATTSHKTMSGIPGETCLTRDKTAVCHPDVNKGGRYCTRSFSGVCQPCYIPNTAQEYPHKNSTPVCHWDVLTVNADYVHLRPNCSSDLPRDLCCLYSHTCNATLMAGELPFDEDGYAYIASMQSTRAMVRFLQGAFQDAFKLDVSPIKLAHYAYWLWGPSPVQGSTLQDTLKRLRSRVA